MSCPKTFFTLILAGFIISQNVSAQIVVNEIMYDLKIGGDDGREWIEILNRGNESVLIATSTWRFFENNKNHELTLFQGSASIAPGGFAIIADNPKKFLGDWPQFADTIFDSSFSLLNSGTTIGLKNGTSTIIDQATYNSAMGANGDGTSLQFIDGILKAQNPTPGLSNSNLGSSTVSSNQNENIVSSTTATVNIGSSSVSGVSVNDSDNLYWPLESKILSRIVSPNTATAIVGADINFRGEALGLDKQPLLNARYLWNFGDGATKEGESVLHWYNFPGEYVVVLDVSSGKFSVSSRTKVKVVAVDLVISAIVAGPEGKIELLNNSDYELNISWWRLSSGGNFFS